MSLQLQRLTAGEVSSATSVIFDSVVYLSGNFSYDNTTVLLL